MSEQELTLRFQRYLDDEMSSEEAAGFLQTLQDNAQSGQWQALILELLGDRELHGLSDSDRMQSILDHILQQPAQPAPVWRLSGLSRHWWRYAAAILIIAGTGGYWWLHRQADPLTMLQPVPAGNDIAPGRDGAILTLADGTQVALDSLGNGVVAQQQGADIVLKNGQLQYNAAASSVVTYNTMSTPRGRQFQLQLPDGTRVWMNAASSIRYPVVFTGNERKVEVSGELYFEVARNASMPFKVVRNQVEVQVTGTHFNVNSYEDEADIRVTLLEGAVSVKSDQRRSPLIPGQQARIATANGNDIQIVNDVDLHAVMAWKDGAFSFEGKPLQEILRQLARWYDIDIVYESVPPVISFGGEMGRDVPLSKVVEFLQESDVQLRIEKEGRKLIVTK